MLCSNDGSPPLNKQFENGQRGVFPHFFPVFPRFPLKLSPFPLLPEDEEDGAAEAEGGPDEIEAEFLAHEEQCERHEDRERNDLLHDLQLGEREGGVTDASENMSRGFLFKSFS